MKRSKIIGLMLLLLGFLKRDHIRPMHILEKEPMRLFQKVYQNRLVYAWHHAHEVEPKLNPAVAECVVVFTKGL